jgi:sodium pump decarboxylase gamma subunit
VSDFVHGLYITALGMGLVFLTLGAILLLMTALVRLFPTKGQPARETPDMDAPAGNDLEQEKIAAISAALAHALAQTPAAGAADRRIVAGQGSGWVAAGRSRQVNHPQSREKRS